MSYKEKYLKYKSKYLKLKNSVGGNGEFEEFTMDETLKKIEQLETQISLINSRNASVAGDILNTISELKIKPETRIKLIRDLDKKLKKINKLYTSRAEEFDANEKLYNYYASYLTTLMTKRDTTKEELESISKIIEEMDKNLETLSNLPGLSVDIELPTSIESKRLDEYLVVEECTFTPDNIKLSFNNKINNEEELKFVMKNLPRNVKQIKFDNNFNINIDGVIPEWVTYIMFGVEFNQSVALLPNSLEILTFGFAFNQPLSNLPESLKEITFGYSFNQPLPKLPPFLKKLIFGRMFNQPLPPLPDSLKILTFGNYFNQPLPKIPESLEILTFGNFFNQPLPPLPETLRELRFGDDFNQPLPTLPESLRKLILGEKFRQARPTGRDNLIILYDRF